jgi:hypothetical protein
VRTILVMLPRLPDLFTALAKSKFRRRFRLNATDAAYLRDRGLDVVLQHAADFIDIRLAPAHPANDGKQTPWRGHPVFVAQHATATCCRGCLEKWHKIPKGRPIDAAEREHILATLRHWLELQPTAPTTPPDATLFDSAD